MKICNTCYEYSNFNFETTQGFESIRIKFEELRRTLENLDKFCKIDNFGNFKNFDSVSHAHNRS